MLSKLIKQKLDLIVWAVPPSDLDSTIIKEMMKLAAKSKLILSYISFWRMELASRWMMACTTNTALAQLLNNLGDKCSKLSPWYQQQIILLLSILFQEYNLSWYQQQILLLLSILFQEYNLSWYQHQIILLLPILFQEYNLSCHPSCNLHRSSTYPSHTIRRPLSIHIFNTLTNNCTYLSKEWPILSIEWSTLKSFRIIMRERKYQKDNRHFIKTWLMELHHLETVSLTMLVIFSICLNQRATSCENHPSC